MVSTNLVDWAELRSIPTIQQALDFTELVPAGQPTRFYRAVIQE
jgi:hypothetical protein